METIYTDIAVLGGGAAGLACAVHAARAARCAVTILERNPRLGKKLINTGNGRCNLSHTPIEPKHFHGERTLVNEVFSKTMTAEDFFLSLGLKCRIDSHGNVYPYANTAASVIDALRLETAKHNIQELTSYNAVKIEPLLEGFRIYPQDSGQLSVTARRLIVASGGKAAPSTGSDGSCFELLKKLDIKILNPLPSLCPIKTAENLTRPMKGLRVNAQCSAILEGKVLRTETGEVQFGDGQLSGICIFNLSRYAAIHKEKSQISIDFTPDISLTELSEFISQAAKIRKAATIEDLLSGLLPKRIAVTLTKQITQLPLTAPVSRLSLQELEALALLLKDCRFPVYENEQWQNAQTTAGGVVRSELTGTLCSKKYPHLYFAGEVINVDGDCGGYNLLWCWRSGELAGRSAAKTLGSGIVARE